VILDTSVILAVLLEEPDFGLLLAKLNQAKSRSVSTTNLVECSMVFAGRSKDSKLLLTEFLQEFEVTTIPFSEVHWRVATDAFLRFGKGRHPAALNFGDCMAYATAKVAGQPLLCIGNDFVQTDLALA
jgi:ribonuclease VapC